MATVPYPFPFPYHAASPPFPAAATYHPSSLPFFPPPPPPPTYPYPHPVAAYAPPPGFFPYSQILVPPPTTASPATALPPHPEQVPRAPLYSGGYCSAPPTHPYPAPFLPNHYSQFHSPPPDWPSPPTPALAPTGDPANSVMPATTLPIRPESWSPNLRTTASASKMQPDRSLVALHDHAQSSLLQDSEVNAFQHHTTLPSISASKMANASVPDGLIAMEPSQASRTAEDFPVLCTDECTDQKDAEKSGSVLHHATPAALPDHTPLLLLQEGKVDAIQHHTTGLYLGRLPSSSTTNKKDVAVLSHSRIDSALEVFGEIPTSGTGYVYCPGHHNISLNTCVLDRNGNLSEQNIDDMPQASGFHNLNCKSVVLEPMFAVYKDETDSSSSEFFDVSATATDRLQSQPFEQLPVFDVYDDDTEGFSNESVDVFAIKPEKQPCDLDINTGCSLKLDTENCIIEFSAATSSLPSQQEQLHQVHTREYNLMLTAKGIQEWDPGILTPSSMYLWLQGLTARIATEKPLSWLPIPELTKWQSQVTSACFVWDPGTMLLSYKCKWWLLYAEEKINWLTETKSYGVALWLVHFLPP